MEKFNKRKLLLILASGLTVAALVLGIEQFIVLRKAHSTFENYYAFRGCTSLVTSTDSYGICQLPSGGTIKIVEYRGKWYLNNDLPPCWFGFCL